MTTRNREMMIPVVCLCIIAVVIHRNLIHNPAAGVRFFWEEACPDTAALKAIWKENKLYKENAKIKCILFFW